MGTIHGTRKHRRPTRARRPRPRICLRKGCRHKYQPRCWNQRYCQDPQCQRELDRWLAARRQAKRRQDPHVKARHAQDQKERRRRAKTAPKPLEEPDVAPARGHAANPAETGFFSLPICDRPGCYEPPVTSSRNPARFCCAACRGAVRRVRDRERKWLRRGTLEGRHRRTIEYQAARGNRLRSRQATPADSPPQPPPQ